MRILVLPAVGSAPTWYTDSSFIQLFEFIRYWGDKVFCYVAFDHKLEYIPDEFNVPNVEFVQIPSPFTLDQSFMRRQAYINQSVCDPFNPYSPTFPVDVVLTTRTGCAGQIAMLMTDVLRSEFPNKKGPPIVTMELMADGMFDYVKGAQWDERLASYVAAPPILLTETEKKKIRGHVLTSLSAVSLMKLMKGMVVHSQGVDTDRIFKIRATVTKNKEFTLFFAGRFNAVKNWTEVADAFQKYFQAGAKVRIRAVKNTAKRLGDLDYRRFDKVEFLERMPHDEYIKTIAECHIGACLSQSETFPVGYFEQIVTGIPVIILNADWVVDSIGKDYPFLIDSIDQLYPMIKYIQKNYAECCKKAEECAQMLHRKFSKKDSAAWLLTELETRLENSYFDYDIGPEVVKMLGDHFGDSFTLDEAIPFLAKERSLNFDPLGFTYGYAGMTTRDLCRMIRLNGFDDKLDGPVIQFERRK